MANIWAARTHTNTEEHSFKTTRHEHAYHINVKIPVLPSAEHVRAHTHTHAPPSPADCVCIKVYKRRYIYTKTGMCFSTRTHVEVLFA